MARIAEVVWSWFGAHLESHLRAELENLDSGVDEKVLASAKDSAEQRVMHYSSQQSIRNLVIFQALAFIFLAYYLWRNFATDDNAHFTWGSGGHDIGTHHWAEVLAGLLQVMVGTPAALLLYRWRSRMSATCETLLRSFPMLSFTLACLLTEDNAERFGMYNISSVKAAFGVELGPNKYNCNVDNTSAAVLNGGGCYLILTVLPRKRILYTVLSSLLVFYIPSVAMACMCQDPGIHKTVPHIFGTMGMWLLCTTVRCTHMQAQYYMFLAMERYKCSWIDEKLTRCKMEFEVGRKTDLERTSRTWQVQSQHAGVGQAAREPSESKTSDKTLLSAPAMLPSLNGRNQICGEGDDCIPETCRVLVKGCDDAVAALSLKLGDSVLCRDSLTDELKYVPIQELSFEDQVSQKCRRIVLTDGSSITVTEDHPIFAKEKAPGYGCFHRAVDLLPGVHRISCYRQVDLEVEHNVFTERNVRLASVSVERGQRHQILAADSETSPMTQSLPVGSADALIFNVFEQQKIHVGEDIESANTHGLRRSNSEPEFIKPCLESTTHSLGRPGNLEEADVTVARWSIGTARHGQNCVPCRFLKSKSGCVKGKSCTMCHSSDHDGLSYGQCNKLYRRACRDPTYSNVVICDDGLDNGP